MRKRIVAGNWKMHKTLEEGIGLAIGVIQSIQAEADKEKLCILCPPFIHLTHVAELVKEKMHFEAGAQNCHWEEEGAYTGEISAAMVASTGVSYVIIGHSERWEYFAETAGQLMKKVNQALEHHVFPIFCCGEKLKERKAGNHRDVVEQQLTDVVFNLQREQFAKVIIAYEPVWAIGTGEVATPEQAQEMHAFIRGLVKKKYGKETAENTSILYGGSVKPENIGDLVTQPDVDGALVGGASLDATQFWAIAESCG